MLDRLLDHVVITISDFPATTRVVVRVGFQRFRTGESVSPETQFLLLYSA